jgi:flagellar motor component MotA
LARLERDGRVASWSLALPAVLDGMSRAEAVRIGGMNRQGTFLVAHLHGNALQVAVETGRKMAPTGHMPSIQDLDQALQDLQIA